MERNGGFTLFELLIAVFIGTILIMSSAYAIRLGLFSMEREEIWFNNSTKEKASFDFFWQQVSSLYILKATSDNTNDKKNTPAPSFMESKKKESFYFSGEKDVLVFVSPLSLKKHYGQGMIIATYKIVLRENGKYDLMYTESKGNPALIKLFEEIENKLILDRDTTIFFKDCDTISFEYLDKEDSDNEKDFKAMDRDSVSIKGTDLKWKEKISGKIPRAIKLKVSRYGEEQEIISPIMVTY